MKKSPLAISLSLLLALTPLNVLSWSADGPYVGIGPEANSLTLTAATPYLKDSIPVASCNLATDTTCTAFFDLSNYWFPKLHLNNYHGDSLYIRGYGLQSVHIVLTGDNQITTSSEYGINVSTNYLYFDNAAPTGENVNLTINVNSPTARANGIINELGNVSIEAKVNTTISVHSALSANVDSTDEVTGITTPINKNVNVQMNSQLSIDNPTGSFGIYTGHFYASQVNIGVENYGYHPYATITHKINAGYGDAFFYNDFEGTTIPTDARIVSTQPEYTFIHDKTDTLGTFRFMPAAQGFSANFDDTLTEGEDFTTAEARLVASLEKELNPSAYTDLACHYAADGLCPYNPDLFEIDRTRSELVIADDVHTGTYHDNTQSTISADQPYALKIFFTIKDQNKFAFSKLDEIAPVSAGLLNGIATADLHLFGPTRVYLSPQEIYVLAPLTVTPTTTPTPEPEPEPEPQPETQEITIPKAPNTGIVL